MAKEGQQNIYYFCCTAPSPKRQVSEEGFAELLFPKSPLLEALTGKQHCRPRTWNSRRLGSLLQEGMVACSDLQARSPTIAEVRAEAAAAPAQGIVAGRLSPRSTGSCRRNVLLLYEDIDEFVAGHPARFRALESNEALSLGGECD